MADAAFDIDVAHRWFAAEFNNRAWDLVESRDRSAAESERMIHLAHAACVHWLEVGRPINHVRAQCLLATVYALAGDGRAAVRHAERCLALAGEIPNELTPFDRASAYGCAANAHVCHGEMDRAREYHRQAVQFAAVLDADESKIFNELYSAPVVS
jgi:ATP/maltotriose-dependent transcriptional regulator MalT